MDYEVTVSAGARGDDVSEAERERRLREEEAAETRREEQRKQRLVELKASEREALRVASTSVEQAADMCDRAVRRRALMSYFGGMLIGVLLFTGLGILLGQILAEVKITGFNLERFLTTYIAGAVGAIVSVMTRLSGSGVAIDYETGRGYLALLGAFRPLIGATFGVALYFGIASGILQAAIPDADNEVFFFFAFIAFLAGFSERWAKDTLVVGRDQVAGSAQK
jgi:hypothetical protein